MADPWITLAAVDGATERVRIGPIVTPLASPDHVRGVIRDGPAPRP